MPRQKSIPNVKNISRRNVSRKKVDRNHGKWDRAILDAQELLGKAEMRAARLRGAIKTFEELRDIGAEYSGPESAAEI